MEPSYKICILGKNNNIKEIIVFSREPTEDQMESPFNESEQTFIEYNSISVRYSSQKIHKDDSITAIKNKCLKELEFSVSYDELYLFSNIHKVILPFCFLNSYQNK